MPELTQRMIDAGATFFDSNGIPTRPDGTPALEENRPQENPEGVLARIERQFSQIPLSDAPAAAFSELPAVGEGAFYDNPTAFKPRSPDAGSGYPAVFGQGAPPAGWFNLNDYYSMINPRPPIPEGYDQFNPLNNVGNPQFAAYDNWTPGTVPDRFRTGSGMSSTNDWRLLPAPYNTPDFFMINGEIIDRRNIGQSTHKDQFGAPPATGYNSGANVGYPIAFTNPGWQGTTGFGFPGSISGWHFGPSTGIT